MEGSVKIELDLTAGEAMELLTRCLISPQEDNADATSAMKKLAEALERNRVALRDIIRLVS